MGAVAIEMLEAWLLAVAGERRSEDLRRPEERLAEVGVPWKDTDAMVALVERRGLSGIPDDARSLRRWLARATAVLGDRRGP